MADCWNYVLPISPFRSACFSYVYADLPHLASLRSATETPPRTKFHSGGSHSSLSPRLSTGDRAGPEQVAPASGKKSDTLQETSKLSLIRYVSGEFAKAQEAAAGRKRGFILYADKPIDEESLNHAVSHARRGGECRRQRPDHQAGISRARDYRGREWRRAAQESLARPYSVWHGRRTRRPTAAPPPANGQDQGPPGFQQGRGGTIYLQFAKNCAGPHSR